MDGRIFYYISIMGDGLRDDDGIDHVLVFISVNKSIPSVDADRARAHNF